MTTYYKVTNVSAQTEKGARAHFLVEVGKRIGPGETLYNLTRLKTSTIERSERIGLHVEASKAPFKEPAAPPVSKAPARNIPRVIEVSAEPPPLPKPEPEAKAEEAPAEVSFDSTPAEDAPAPDSSKKTSSSKGRGKSKDKK